MANKRLFDTKTAALPKADTTNEAGGVAYSFESKHALAQYCCTGCLNDTYYADAKHQLDKVLLLCGDVDTEFIAKTAVYARQHGHMKDMPALLCAVLAARDVEVLKRVFPVVIDNGKMLRTFVQILRSGVVGRKSFGRAVKRLILNWFSSRQDDQIFRQSIGNDPSFADILRMVHPVPNTPQREALYGYLLKRETVKTQNLPDLVKHYEQFKAGETTEVPDVPFQFLASLNIGTREWTEIARTATWQTLRMNLNTFARHGVFESKEMIKLAAKRLRDPEEIKRAKVLPYQLMVAYLNTQDLPVEITNALQDAMELSVQNVPIIDGKVWVFPDVSGSMGSPVTGHRSGATSKVRCIDVAALVAASILRRNPEAEVLPFAIDVVNVRLNPKNAILENAAKLASINGGGTDCSAPLARLNHRKDKGDVCIYVSDNQSWVDSVQYHYRTSPVPNTTQEWTGFRGRNPKAKLICIDIQPYSTTQVPDRGSAVLNIGGFSDQVFDLIHDFCQGDRASWVQRIENVEV